MRSYDSLPDTPFRCEIVQKWQSRNPLLNSEIGSRTHSHQVQQPRLSREVNVIPLVKWHGRQLGLRSPLRISVPHQLEDPWSSTSDLVLLVLKHPKRPYSGKVRYPSEIPAPLIKGYILVPRLGWETSLFPPVNDKCDSRTRFSNRLGSRSVEKKTPISRQLCTWRKRYSPARSVVSISELIKCSFKMEAAKTLIVF
ncbi:hypothetical protein AVEN_51501-1 [Araneus ventricosus]|uniref:Uncharacterized protein n=1 Tax=Araneus ventricosus TaxID=182803 RepID=A0A4Y2XAF4_ARAVE|nr:hypothetical protein AVEN_51501-1 [Araneus ventricosus]